MTISNPRRAGSSSINRKRRLHRSAMLALLGTVSASQLSSAQTLYWDGNGVAPLGGAGTWDASSLNWNSASDGSGSYSAWSAGNTADFGTPAGAVTVVGTQSATGLTFGANGFSLTGGTISLTGGAVLTAAANTTTTINTQLVGSAGYTKSGAGTVLLTNINNSVTGAILVNGGVLAISTSGRIGSTTSVTGNVTLDGGTLRNEDPLVGNSLLSINKPIVIGAGGGTFDIASASAALVYGSTLTNAPIGGTGTLYKTGPGEFRTPSTNHTFTKLVVLNGTYRPDQASIGGEAGLGATPASVMSDQLTLNGGTLVIGTAFTTSANRGLTIGTNGGRIRNTAAVTWSGGIYGSGTLSKSEFGTESGATLTLPANSGSSGSNFTGVLRVGSATLSLSTANGSVNAASRYQIAGSGVLELNNGGATAGSINNNRISDTADIEMRGGTLRLNNGTASSGSTVVQEAAGTLKLVDGQSLLRLNGAGSAGHVRLDLASLVRDTSTYRPTVMFIGSSLGTSALATQTAGQANITIGGATGFASDMIGTDTDGVGTNQKILPYALTDTSNTASPAGRTFVTYDATSGVRSLAAGEYATTLATDQNVTVTSQSVTSGTPVTINSLRSISTSAITAITLGDDLTVTSGAILNNSTATFGMTFSGAGKLKFTGEGFLSAIGTGASITVSSQISGSSGITKVGGSTLTLNADNSSTLSGPVSIHQGPLALQNVNALGTGSLLLGPGMLGTTAASASTVSFSTAASVQTLPNGISLPVSGNGSLNFAQTVASAQIKLSGKITGGVTGNALRLTGSDGANDTQAFIFDNDTNDFISNITLLEGVLAITKTGAFGSSGNAINLSPFTTGQLATAPIPGGLRFDGDGVTVPQNITLGTQATVNVGTNTGTLSGVISGASRFDKTGAGTLVLSGINTNTGSLTVNAGKVIVLTDAALGTVAGNTIVGTGQSSAVTLAFSSGATPLTYATAEPLSVAGQGLAGAGVIENLAGTNSFAGAITVNGGTNTFGMTAGSLDLRGTLGLGANSVVVAGSGNLRLGGVVSGTGNNATYGAITLNGAGNLTLAGNNTYVGDTYIKGGKLILANTAGSATGTGTVYLDGSTAILAGSGAISGTVTSGAAGGAVAPGNSIGSISVGGMALNALTTLNIEIGGTAGPGVEPNGHDVVIVTGSTLTLGGATLQVLSYNGFTPAYEIGQTFKIVDKTSAGAAPDTFASLAEGAIFSAIGTQFSISYVGGDGNDIVLTTVPEPTTLGLLAVGAMGLMRRRRR